MDSMLYIVKTQEEIGFIIFEIIMTFDLSITSIAFINITIFCNFLINFLVF